MREHSHCPDGCDHPQPFRAVVDGGLEVEFCGRCWVGFEELVEMVPCTPETCPEDA